MAVAAGLGRDAVHTSELSHNFITGPIGDLGRAYGVDGLTKGCQADWQDKVVPRRSCFFGGLIDRLILRDTYMSRV